MITAQRHHSAFDACHQLAVLTLDVTPVVANRSALMRGPGVCPQAGLPNRAQERRFQVDAGKAFALFHQRGMRRADGGIRQLAQQSAMDGALLVAMHRGIGLQFDGGHGTADGDYAKSQQLGDRRRVAHMRDISSRQGAIQLAL